PTHISPLSLHDALPIFVVASLAVTNTMFTAVVERRREIGLRRVVGATRRQVVGWLVAEAASLGIAGSLLGLLAGTLAVAGLNARSEEHTSELQSRFDLVCRLL